MIITQILCVVIFSALLFSEEAAPSQGGDGDNNEGTGEFSLRVIMTTLLLCLSVSALHLWV